MKKDSFCLGQEHIMRFREELSFREIAYLLLVYIVLFVINYIIKALGILSMTYSSQLPSFWSMRYIAVGQCLWYVGYFACKRAKCFFEIVIGLHLLLLCCLFAIWATTGTFFCESVLYLVYDTSWAEVKDFLSAYLNVAGGVKLLCIVLLSFALLYLIHKCHIGEKKRTRIDLYCGVVFLFIFMCLPTYSWVVRLRDRQMSGSVLGTLKNVHPVFNYIDTLRFFSNNMGQYTREMRHREVPHGVSMSKSFINAPVMGVLVIGESNIRQHFSLYGYKRPTTPQLDLRQKNIIAFDDCITVLPMTITALKYWLTDMTLDNRHVHWTIFDVLKSAGYHIDILSNQNKSGWADSPIQMIFSSADSVKYMHEESISELQEASERKFYDELLLPDFSTWVEKISSDKSGTPCLLVIHLFGSHDPFRSRYPQNIDRIFLDDTQYEKLINEYDTSIYYTDKILGQILRKLEFLKSPAFLIYFSDHGTVCDTNHLRTPNSIENSAYEIPFFVWSNRGYQTVYSETYQRMVEARHVPMQADRGHVGLLEIMGVTGDFMKPEDNFLSPDFLIKKRTVKEGEAPYCPSEVENR